MCGVGHPFVESIRPEALETVTNATRTTKDGRQYPATRMKDKPETEEENNEIASSALDEFKIRNKKTRSD